MKVKDRYQPSKIISALFATAVAKIKDHVEKVIAEQKAISEAEVVATIAKEVSAGPRAEETIEGETVEAHGQSEDELQEAELVSRNETEETFESEAEQEAEAAEQKAEDADTAFEDVAEEKVELETESFEQTGTNETKSEAEPVSRNETEETFESEAEQEAEAAEQKAEDADTAFEDVAEEEVEITAESQEPAAGEVSKSIQQMAHSQSNQPREQSLAGSGLCAKDVMLKELVWGNPEDSVQQAITKMQQYDSGYLMVGIDGVLEGIVSNSNITGALSPYLRPVFAKWRQPLDDATLQIRIKWIMSRPVRTVKPETSLVTIIGNMCQFSQRAFPVVDEQGKVQGLVTVFGIFKVLSNSTNISMVGKASEAHPLEQVD